MRYEFDRNRGYGVRGGRVYIIGPMDGPKANRDTYADAAHRIRRAGVPACDPHEVHPWIRGDQSEYLRRDVVALSNCKAAVVLPGWANSEGAKFELAACRAQNIPVYDVDYFCQYLAGTRLAEDVHEIDYREVLERIHDANKPEETPRASVLNEARELTTGDRNNTYGPPTQDFLRTAEMLTALGFKGPYTEGIEPHHVAMMIMCVKLSRLTWSPKKRDNWTDAAGYAACGYECTLEGDEDGSN